MVDPALPLPGHPGYLVLGSTPADRSRSGRYPYIPLYRAIPGAGFAATLRLEEISRVEVPGHITTIGLNNAFLSTQTWDWKQRKVFTVTVPAGLMIDGLNTVTVGALNQPATAAALHHSRVTHHAA